jgi:molybdopterin synthase sulfur carrier subunit
MAARIILSGALRDLLKNKSEMDVEGESLAEIIDTLDGQFPGFKERMCDKRGGLRRFVRVFVNGTDVRELRQLDTRIESWDRVTFVPAIAGG